MARGLFARQRAARPSTREAESPSYRSRLSPGQSVGFDFGVDAAPLEAGLPSHLTYNHVAGNMIGVALGSPGVSNTSQLTLPSSLPDEPAAAARQTSLQRKPSKWSKLGGMFKPKHAAAAAAPPRVPQQKTVDPVFPTADINEWPAVAGDRANFSSVRSSPDTEHWRKDTPSDLDREEWPRLESVSNASPFLQVDIPTIEMERYSVMFGGLLGKQPAPLLARRSRTLGDVRMAVEEKPMTLSPDVYEPPRPRRPTSPASLNSPSFTLFPATPVPKPQIVRGLQTLPSGPSPLRRAQTAPVAHAAKQEPIPQARPVVPRVTTTTTTTTAAAAAAGTEFLASHHQPSASDVSLHSPASPDPVLDEKQLLTKLKQSRSQVNLHTQEPAWEMLPRRPSPHPRLKLTTEGLPSTTRTDHQDWSASSPSSATKLKADKVAAASSRSAAVSQSPIDEKENRPARDGRAARSGLTQLSSGSPSPSRTAVAATTTTTTAMTMHQSKNDAAAKPAPTAEVMVSVARSVSVSRAKRQVLVGITSRPDRPKADDKLVVSAKPSLTPRLIVGEHAHRPGNSHDARVESVF